MRSQYLIKGMMLIALATFTVALVNLIMEYNHFKTLKRKRNRSTNKYFQTSVEHEIEFDHMMVLGGLKEINQILNLSFDKAKAQLGALVRKIDLNSDKKIDKQEMKTWLVKSIKQFLKDEAEREMKTADKNRDGKVTWKEYTADIYGLSVNDEFNYKKEIEQISHYVRAMWSAADGNGDDALEEDEWLMFHNEREYPAMHPYLLKDFLDDFDTDKDGVIDFQEYTAVEDNWAMSSSQEFQESKKSENFKREAFDFFDKDGNEKLSGEEIISWRAPGSEQQAEKELKYLFGTSDKNKPISYSDVVNHYSKFI